MSRSEYLLFDEAPRPPGRRTRIVQVLARRTGNPLGLIVWRGAWRQYVFEPERDTVFSRGCMADINETIEQLMAERRQP